MLAFLSRLFAKPAPVAPRAQPKAGAPKRKTNYALRNKRILFELQKGTPVMVLAKRYKLTSTRIHQIKREAQG